MNNNEKVYFGDRKLDCYKYARRIRKNKSTRRD